MPFITFIPKSNLKHHMFDLAIIISLMEKLTHLCFFIDTWRKFKTRPGQLPRVPQFVLTWSFTLIKHFWQVHHYHIWAPKDQFVPLLTMWSLIIWWRWYPLDLCIVKSPFFFYDQYTNSLRGDSLRPCEHSISATSQTVGFLSTDEIFTRGISRNSFV